jgi:hypothetical protein
MHGRTSFIAVLRGRGWDVLVRCSALGSARHARARQCTRVVGRSGVVCGSVAWTRLHYCPHALARAMLSQMLCRGIHMAGRHACIAWQGYEVGGEGLGGGLDGARA